jgi:hypothetical protein
MILAHAGVERNIKNAVVEYFRNMPKRFTPILKYTLFLTVPTMNSFFFSCVLSVLCGNFKLFVKQIIFAIGEL